MTDKDTPDALSELASAVSEPEMGLDDKLNEINRELADIKRLRQKLERQAESLTDDQKEGGFIPRRFLPRQEPRAVALQNIDAQYDEIKHHFAIKPGKPGHRSPVDYECIVNRAWRKLFKHQTHWGEVPIIVEDDGQNDPTSKFNYLGD